MSHSEANLFLEDASRDGRLLTRNPVREEPRLCPVCGARVAGDDPTIQIRGTRVHMRCAVYRRRLVRR